MTSTLKVESPVKSVQRGVQSIFMATTVGVTVNAVNMSKSVLTVTCENGYLSNTQGGGAPKGSSGQYTAAGELTTPTNINILTGQARNFGTPTIHTVNAIAYWELVEYE